MLAFGGKTVIEGRFVEALHALDADRLIEKLERFGDGDHVHVMTPHQDTAPVPCRLLVLTPDGQAAAALELSLTTRTAGRAGTSVQGADLHGVVQVRLHLDHPREGVPMSGGMEVTLSGLAGHWPSAIRQVAELLVAAEANEVIEVQMGDKPVARGHVREPLSVSVLEAARLVIVLDDLRELTGVHFPTPAAVVPAEMAMLSALRDLHAGDKAVLTRATISAQVTEQGRAHLLQVIDDNSECALTIDMRWEQSCAGHSFPPVANPVRGSRRPGFPPRGLNPVQRPGAFTSVPGLEGSRGMKKSEVMAHTVMIHFRGESHLDGSRYWCLGSRYRSPHDDPGVVGVRGAARRER
ncbi:hypothetical protein ACGFI3_25565 [Nonomuraea wenchangensis]|uniref:hypothetical protein n=1 Tax=Nonomuraea wenchangensis TaxID=568860 RepID=UPI00371BDC4F